MLNFELYNPTNLVFGKGQIEKLATLVPFGSKILLAYGGGSIFKNGIYNQVQAALSGFEIRFINQLALKDATKLPKKIKAEYLARIILTQNRVDDSEETLILSEELQ